MAYNRTHGVRTRIVRIFNTYGPRMALDDGRVVPNFICQALKGKSLTVYGDGSQTRSFCYIDDLVDGIIRLMSSEIPEPTNIGNPHEVTILEFANTINSLTDNTTGTILEDKRTQGDPQQRKPDISKAEKLLSWKPQVKLEDGLTRTISYFRSKLASSD